METESNQRRRARCVLELSASYAAIKSWICSPTTLRVRFGARDLGLHSFGKCVCNHRNFNAVSNIISKYLMSFSFAFR